MVLEPSLTYMRCQVLVPGRQIDPIVRDASVGRCSLIYRNLGVPVSLDVTARPCGRARSGLLADQGELGAQPGLKALEDGPGLFLANGATLFSTVVADLALDLAERRDPLRREAAPFTRARSRRETDKNGKTKSATSSGLETGVSRVPSEVQSSNQTLCSSAANRSSSSPASHLAVSNPNTRFKRVTSNRELAGRFALVG
jgi:hypothetical protein